MMVLAWMQDKVESHSRIGQHQLLLRGVRSFLGLAGYYRRLLRTLVVSLLL